MATLNRYTVLAAAIALACSAWAQQPPNQYSPDQNSAGQYQDSSDQVAQNQADPPSRVARLSYLSGEVSFAPGGENDWVSAQRNRPLTTGDKLYTDNGRAELQIGTSSIYLNQRSNMDFLTLNDQMTQIELTQGSLTVNVRRLRSGEVYEVDTPTIAFIADQVGSYRIDVDPNGQTTTVSVTRGAGDAVGEGGNRVRVDAGTRVVFNDPQLNNYQSVDLQAGDNFDTYVTERVARYERAPARRYVSEEVVGYEDLDDNGSWEDAPEYGHVWYPHGVAADWAPYHDGNWVWSDPYGWSWVDNSDWGFAPFHYGRWAYVGSRWGWVPGPVDVRPVYAPALVAFVGGGGFGVDISVGGPIGWFPLGPRDVYFPSYRVGRDYFRNVNISNTVVNNTVINNYYGAFSAGNVNYAQINYANRMVPRAVTAVPTNAFVSGRPVAASAIAVNPTQLANARVMSRATVAPTAASLVASRARATPPPAAAMNRPVVAANRPAPAPAPFAQRQAVLRQNPGQPLTPVQMRTMATRGAPARGATATIAVPTRPNVRLANQAGANAPVVNARANANARATANAPGNNRVAPQATPMNARQQAQANQQTQANARANTQGQGRVQGTLPSSRYTQQSRGAPPRESTTAQQNAAANARFNRGNTAPTPTPRESATAQQNGAANARFNRGNAAPTTPANTAQSRAAEAQQRAQQQSERAGAQRMQAQNRANEARANAQAQQQSRASEQQHMAQQRAQQQSERAGTQRMQAQNRANEARANAQAQQQSRASEQQQRNMAQQRAAQQQERGGAQRMEAQNRAAAQTQQRAQAQARVQQQQEQRAPAQTQRAPVQQQREQAPVQQRAQAQYREPPRPTSQPQPRPAQQQTPQQRQEAKRKNEKDRDQQNGGGGG